MEENNNLEQSNPSVVNQPQVGQNVTSVQTGPIVEQTQMEQNVTQVQPQQPVNAGLVEESKTESMEPILDDKKKNINQIKLDSFVD